MTSEPPLSLVIPSYNEAGNIPLLAERVARLQEALPGVEVLLVDNGSTDASPEAFRRCFGEGGGEGVRVIRVPVNQGYGFGILAGLRDAKGRFLAWTHADMQTDLLDVAAAYRAAQAAEDPQRTVVKGSRRRRNPLDAAFTMGMTVVSSAALGTQVNDVNAQPKLFPRGLFGQFENPPHDFSLDLYLLYLARRKGYALRTVPVDFGKRLHGEAKGGGSLRTKVKLTKRTFTYIFKLRAHLKAQGA